MLKSRLCLFGCALHYVIAGILIAWIVMATPIGWGLLIADGVFLVMSAIVGIAFLKLNLDKLFQKFESGSAETWDKITVFANLILALLVVIFEIVMVAVFFFQNAKMETHEWIRFTLLPNMLLAHLVIATGFYLAMDYFTTELLAKIFDQQDEETPPSQE